MAGRGRRDGGVHLGAGGHGAVERGVVHVLDLAACLLQLFLRVVRADSLRRERGGQAQDPRQGCTREPVETPLPPPLQSLRAKPAVTAVEEDSTGWLLNGASS